MAPGLRLPQFSFATWSLPAGSRHHEHHGTRAPRSRLRSPLQQCKPIAHLATAHQVRRTRDLALFVGSVAFLPSGDATTLRRRAEWLMATSKRRKSKRCKRTALRTTYLYIAEGKQLLFFTFSPKLSVTVTVTVTKIAAATRARPPYATTRTPPCRAQPWDGVCWYDSVTLSHVRRPSVAPPSRHCTHECAGGCAHAQTICASSGQVPKRRFDTTRRPCPRSNPPAALVRAGRG